MRNGNQSRQLLSLARIFVLALCFTLVFAVALSTIGNVDMSGTSIAANEDDNEAKGGIVSVTADQGPLSAELFGFPGTDPTKKSWSATLTFNNTKFDSTNVSNFLSSGSANVGGVVGSTGSFRATEFDDKGNESSHGVGYAPYLYSAVNYTFSDFMVRLMASSNYTVTAKMTSTMNKHHGGTSVNRKNGFALVSAKGKIKAQEKANENGDNIDIEDGNVSWTTNSNNTGTFSATTGDATFTSEKQTMVMLWVSKSGVSMKITIRFLTFRLLSLLRLIPMLRTVMVLHLLTVVHPLFRIATILQTHIVRVRADRVMLLSLPMQRMQMCITILSQRVSKPIT